MYNIKFRIQEVLTLEANSVLAVSKIINKQHENVVLKLLSIVNNGGRLAISGIGKNYSIAHKISSTFNSLNIPSYHFDAFHALHGDLGAIQPNDGVVYLSRSGNTAELVETSMRVASLGVYQLAITCNENAAISKFTDDCVCLPFTTEADKYDLVPTSSSTLLLSFGDSIGIVMSELLGMTKEDFFKNHPAGSLGKRLSQEFESVTENEK